jgi:hypothetical protein
MPDARSEGTVSNKHGKLYQKLKIMNNSINGSLPVDPPQPSQVRFRLFPLAGSIGKLSVCLAFALAFLCQPAHAQSLVGEWLTGSTNLTDVSGYSPVGTHDAFIVGNGNYEFTNDLPPAPGASGQSIFFPDADTGLAITNSSTLDGNYDNTFDNAITNAFTVTCWAKGFPGSWNPFVSKYGESSPESGWQLREDGSTGETYGCFTVRNGSIGDVTLGAAVYGNSDDMATRTIPSNDGQWHLYVGTFSALTGQRILYIDAVVAAMETNDAPDIAAPAEHLCIEAKDSPPGDSFGNYSTNEIYDVRVYNYALSQAQVQTLYGENPPAITVQPLSIYTYPGSNAQISVVHFTGTQPFAYQWQFNGTNLASGINFSGVNSNILTVLNATASDVGSYRLIVSNIVGSTVSSNATLTIQNPSLVGEWLNGSGNLADVSGFSPAGTHDGFIVGGGNFEFTNDVPPYMSGQSIYFPDGDTGIAISNSSTLDANYTNTFDGPIGNAFTVTCWARGFPTSWNPWVSKYGENSPESGWQIRDDGSVNNGQTYACFSVRDNGAGAVTMGTGVYGNPDDMSTDPNDPSNDGNWHLYAGVFDSATGMRTLYIDTLPAATETGNVPYGLAAAEHLCIGAKDSPPGNTFGNYSADEIYDVRVYNYALSESQLVYILGPIPPRITGQPQSMKLYQGLSAQFEATGIVGPAPFTYQWQLNGTNLVNSANISGVNSNILTVLNVAANDVGTYQLIVSNLNGTTPSSNATLTVVTPVPGSYEAAVLADHPLAFWKLDETNDPSVGGVLAFDYISGFDGVYAVNAENGFDNIAGPSFAGFPANYTALLTQNAVADSYVTASAGSLVASNLTYAMWINPNSPVPNSTGLLFDRGGAGEGLGFGVTNDPDTGMSDLGYTWNKNSQATWSWDSDLFPPQNQWSFVAWVLSPTKSMIYLINSSGVQSSTHAIVHDSEVFGEAWNIGNDSSGGTGSRTFPGSISDVSVFLSALSSNQVVTLYDIGVGVAPPPPPVPLQIARSGAGSATLTWSQGTLLEATSLAGPWTTNSATSPYLVPETNSQMFFKVINQ